MTDTPEDQHILIVDDIPINLKVLAKTLTSAGFDIAVATRGEMALQQAQEDPPALILLDVLMPGLDGFEICRRLKQNPITQDIPIIFMTALVDSVDKVRGLSLGAVDYITKPFQEDEVLARVRVHLHLRALTKTLAHKNQQLSAAMEKLQTAQQQMMLQEKLATIGFLTAGIAHELRNPLNFINNYAEGSIELIDELLEEIELQAEKIATPRLNSIKELLGDIRENTVIIDRHGKRAEDVIQNLLMQVRTDENQIQLTDINTLLDQTLKLVDKSNRFKDNRLNVEVEADYDQTIKQYRVMPSELSRAFINLLDNAYYTLQGKQKKYSTLLESQKQGFTPRLSVRTRNLGNSVEIRIRDNGMGIKPDVKTQIFHPFFTTKPLGEGTGLGLAITQNIILNEHQGTIRVETEPGTYTEFIITLQDLEN